MSVAIWCDIAYKDFIHENSIHGLIIAMLCNFLPGEHMSVTWMDWRCDVHATLHQNLLLEEVVALTLQLSITPPPPQKMRRQLLDSTVSVRDLYCHLVTWWIVALCLQHSPNNSLQRKRVIAYRRPRYKQWIAELLRRACFHVTRIHWGNCCQLYVVLQWFSLKFRFPFIAWFEREINQIICRRGSHILTPNRPETYNKNPFPNCKLCSGKRVSRHDGLFQRNIVKQSMWKPDSAFARNQATILDQWIAASNVIGVHWINRP